MKITLNLLPKDRKRKIKNRKILKLFVWQEGILIFAVFLLAGIIAGTNEIISVKTNMINTQVNTSSAEGNYAEIKKYENSLNDVKNSIKIIDKVQKNNINWTPVFQEISESIPDGIVITSISNVEYSVVVAGIAENRDRLIEMKSKVEKSSCFENVSVPINDIVLKSDIEFRVDFNVSKNCLIKV